MPADDTAPKNVMVINFSSMKMVCITFFGDGIAKAGIDAKSSIEVSIITVCSCVPFFFTCGTMASPVVNLVGITVAALENAVQGPKSGPISRV